MNEAREILKIARGLMGASMPKVPGVSPARLKKWLEEAKEPIANGVSDAYYGAGWTAEWKVEEVDEFGGVSKASLVEASGAEDITIGAVGWGVRGLDDATLQAVNVALAQGLRGLKYPAKAKFSWRDGDFEFSAGRGEQPKPGDIFESTGDSFYGGFAPTDQVVEANIVIKVKRASFRKRDDEMRVSASFETT